MQDYHKLKVWEKAQALALEIRRATRKFSRSEYRGLRSQMIDAAESIVFNIVEGCGTSSAKEFARFLDMATKSASEVQGQLELSHHYGALPEDEWERLTTAVVEIRRMLCGLRKKVLAANPPPPPRRRSRSEPSRDE